MAKSRLEKVGEVYWGPRQRGAEHELKRAYTDWPLILESVLKDYALIGKESIMKVAQRAQTKLREKYAPKS